jgi:hypothetical protein
MEEKLQLTQKSSSCTKIALFRSLFRGREDLGKRLDDVLDSILRVLSKNQENKTTNSLHLR